MYNRDVGLRTDDIEGAQPRKFRHGQKGHNIVGEVSQHINGLQRANSYLLNNYSHALPTHEMYEIPEVAGKIGRPNADHYRRDMAQDGYPTGHFMGQVFMNQAGPTNSQIATKNNQNQGVFGTNSPPQQAQKKQDFYAGPPVNQQGGNLGGNNYSNNQHNRNASVGNDSLDVFKQQVEAKEKDQSDKEMIQYKKAMHQFYGLTPPPSRYGEHYSDIKVNKYVPQQNQMRESYYQRMNQDTIKKAQNEIGFDVNLKNFFGVSLTEKEQFQKNYDRFYRGCTPVDNSLKGGVRQKAQSQDFRHK